LELSFWFKAANETETQPFAMPFFRGSKKIFGSKYNQKYTAFFGVLLDL